MNALIIGGTGTISLAVVELLVEEGWKVWVLNRGTHNELLPNQAKQLKADISQEQQVAECLGDLQFDAVCQFVGFTPDQVERDYRLFQGRTRQYLYISSASAYNKPAASYRITEGTSLANPYWGYSQNKIACEDYLMKQYREQSFPVTIIRPSHTYDKRHIPLGVHGTKGFWQVIRRMEQNKPVLIQGDGSSLWTLTYNSDFAQGFVGLMGNRHAIGEAFQITSSETLTWDQIYATIADALGVELKAYHVASEFLGAVGPQYDLKGGLLGDKAVSVVFDNQKLLRAVPHYCPQVPFHKGVRLALDYILAHPECQQEDPEFDDWCDRVIQALEQAKQNI